MVHLNSWARGLVLTTCALAVAQCGGAPEDNVPARDDSPVVAIPSGEFDMGGRFEDVGGPTTGHSMTYQAERPLHRVRISGFNLDEHEVTVGQYRTFLTYLSASGDSSARHPDQPPEVDHTSGHTEAHRAADHPVLDVTWFSAYAYCKWAGKRLPTEAEWEYAARGNDGVYRKYPWGNNGVNWEQIWFANSRLDADGHADAAPVGSYPDGVSYFGVLDLAGNASEWVQDWYSADYYQTVSTGTDPKGPATGDTRVVKGGSYRSRANDIRSAARSFGAPHESDRYRGFRCARDAE